MILIYKKILGTLIYNIFFICSKRMSLMVQLEQLSQLHEIYAHDLKVMCSNPGKIKLRALGTSVISLY